MHICQITSMHNWDDARIFKRTCMHLSHQGHQVSYIATSNKKEQIEGIDFYPIKPREGWRRRLFGSRQAYKIASHLNADFYHFHDPDLIPWMFFLRLKGKKVIYDIHENFYEKFHHFSFPIKQILILFYSIYELPLRAFTGVVAVSESLRQLYIKRTHQSIVVMNVPPKSALPNPSNIEKAKTPLIYISGQQTAKRNCTQMVEALPIIKASIPNVKLQLVGKFVPESYKETLVNIAKDLGVENSLILEGMIPWEENFKRTAKATLGVVFYEDNPNNRVGIPNRIFEYMACGLPILAENFPELKRIVNNANCGLLVDSSKPDEIANAAIKLLSDQEKSLVMGSNGREATRTQYNFEVEIKKLQNFYHQLS